MKKIFFMFVGVFLFSSPVLAIDPVVELEKQVSILVSKINTGTDAAECRGLNGDRLQFWWRSSFIDVNSFIIDDLETRVSVCYRNKVEQIDKTIQNDIIQKYRKSSLACGSEENYKRLVSDIKSIMTKRENLFTDVQDSGIDTYAKEICVSDPNKNTFDETNKAFEKLKANWKAITQAITDLTPHGTQANVWKTNTWKVDQKKIEQRAQARAQKFVDDFNEFTNLGGILKTQTVRDELGFLPQGKNIVSTMYTQARALFFDGTLTKEARIKRQKLREEYLTKKNTTQSTLAYVHIGHKQEINTAFIMMEESLEKFKQQQEKQDKFDEALTESFIQSLVPFHDTLRQTTQALKAHEKALESVLNNQNIGG